MDAQKCLSCFLLIVAVSTKIFASENKCLRNGIYEHPTDCNKFYTCAPFGPVLMHCPVGLHFNPRYLVCDWPRNAGCAKNNTESAGTDALKSCPIYPHPSDCAKFYMCSPLANVLMECPPSLHFNPYLLVCDWPYSAGCTVNGTLTDVADSISITPISSTSKDNNSQISTTTIKTTWTSDPPETSSHRVDPTTITESRTDVNIGSTDIQNLGTTSNNISEETTTIISNKTILCESSIWPHPDDCTKFFMCGATGAEEKQCPESLHFNPELLVCDWSYRAGCKNNSSMLPETTTTDPTTTISNTYVSELTTDETMIYPTTISETLETNIANNSNESASENWSSGEISSHPNGPSTFTDITTEANTMKESTEWLEPTSTSITDGTTNIDSNETILCESSIWPHPDDCTKFFMCGATGAEEKRCPESLHFNPELLVCDWSYRAGCKNDSSMLPEITTTDPTTTISNTYVSELTTDETMISPTTILEVSETDIANNSNESASGHPEISSHSNVPSTFTDITTEANTMKESTEWLETTSTSITEGTTIINSNEIILCESSIWPHPDDCSKFFMCGATGAEEKECPESLHFNPELLVCDWSYRAGCKYNSSMLPETTTTYPTTTISNTYVSELTTDETMIYPATISETLETNIANNSNESASGHAEISSHPNGPSTFTDITTEANTMKESTEWFETTSTSITEGTTNINSNETILCESDIWPHTDDCTKFFMCGATGAEEKRCPESLHFNPELLVCDWPYQAGCKNDSSILPDTTTDATTTISNTYVSELATDETMISPTTISEILDTNIASENWSSGHSEISSHPNGPSTSTDIVTEANTMKESTEWFETTSTSITEGTTNINPNETILCESSIWPHTYDCTKFFMCGATGAEEKRCPESLHFNPELLVCDWSYRAGCKKDSSMLPNTTTDATTTISNTYVSELATDEAMISPTISEVLETNTANNSNESAYENWSSNYPENNSNQIYPLTIPDITTEVNKIEKSTFTSFTEQATNIESNKTVLCKSSIWPHSDDCTKFFMCGATGPEEKQCPESLYFNSVLLVCDWSYNAGCKQSSTRVSKRLQSFVLQNLMIKRLQWQQIKLVDENKIN